jgi:hypothetical protein
MKKYRRIWYGRVYDLTVMAELFPPRKLRKSEVVVPEPLPEWKPVIRVSPTVVKRIKAEGSPCL